MEFSISFDKQIVERKNGCLAIMKLSIARIFNYKFLTNFT